MNSKRLAGIAAIALASAACVTVHNPNGIEPRYRDVRVASPLGGTGIESQDIIAMTDRMVRDMLANPILVGRTKPPIVIVDASYFVNAGSRPLDKDLITNRLRVELTRAAAGRLVFIGRHRIDMVARERELKDDGVVTVGTLGRTAKPSGADYQLSGSINSQEIRGARSGVAVSYQQITFEMIDLETSEIVWTGIYEFGKEAQDDIVYR
jgi:hypothetical protein